MTARRQLSGEPLRRQFKRRRKWPLAALLYLSCALANALGSEVELPAQPPPLPSTGVISIRGVDLMGRQVRDSVINQQPQPQQKQQQQQQNPTQPNDNHEEPLTTSPLLSRSNSSGGLDVEQQQQQQPQLDGLLAAAESANASGAKQRAEEESFRRRLMELRRKYSTRQAISDTAYYILLPIYSLLILTGTLANALICLTVILRPRILSPRNIFIVNLASSDLLLCVFTMPFSFIEISMRTWQMGLIPCKLVASLQATSIFVSTISIMAIALDRYKVIVYPTHQESAHGTRGAALLVLAVWVGALLLSMPLFRVRTVQLIDLQHLERWTKVKFFEVCIEQWPFEHGRGTYSVVSMMFQYVLPISIVSVVYAKISDKLKKSVSLIFALSWLPLNLFNVISDFTGLLHEDERLFRYVFAACHLIGCSSACSNPILYGYLNENFRKELYQVYRQHARRLSRLVRRLWRSLGGTSGVRANATPSSTANSSRAEVGLEDEEEEEVGADESNPNTGGSSARYSSVPDLSLSARTSNRGQPAHSSCQHLCAPIWVDSNSVSVSASQPANVCTCPGKTAIAASGVDLELSSSARRFSFQTLTSSRQTLGRTMRLCLCVCGDNSRDSLLEQPPGRRKSRGARNHLTQPTCTCQSSSSPPLPPPPSGPRQSLGTATSPQPSQGRRVWLRCWTREPPEVAKRELHLDIRRCSAAQVPRHTSGGELASSSIIGAASPSASAMVSKNCAKCGAARRTAGRRKPTGTPTHLAKTRRTDSLALSTLGQPAAAAKATVLGGQQSASSQLTSTSSKLPTCYLSVETGKSWRRKGVPTCATMNASPSHEHSTEVVLLNATDLDSVVVANEDEVDDCAGVSPSTRSSPQVTVIPAQVARSAAAARSPATAQGGGPQDSSSTVKIELPDNNNSHHHQPGNNDEDDGPPTSSSFAQPAFAGTTDSNSSSCGCLHSHSSSCTCSLSSACPLQQVQSAEPDAAGKHPPEATTRSALPDDSSCSSVSARFVSSCSSTRSASSESISLVGSAASSPLVNPTTRLNDGPAEPEDLAIRCNGSAGAPGDSAIGQSLDDSSSATSGLRRADKGASLIVRSAPEADEELSRSLPPDGASHLAAQYHLAS